jgi:hypothetical protein
MEKQHIDGKTLRRELINQIRNRINSGEDRQSILDDLSSQYYGREQIAGLISSVPLPEDLEAISKYNKWLLRIIYTFAALDFIFNFLNLAVYIVSPDNALGIVPGWFIAIPLLLLVPGICFWFTVRIKQYDYSLIGLGGMLAIYKYAPFENPEDIIAWIIVAMLVVGTWLPFQIEKKFFPKIKIGGLAKSPDGKYMLSRDQLTDN